MRRSFFPVLVALVATACAADRAPADDDARVVDDLPADVSAADDGLSSEPAPPPFDPAAWCADGTAPVANPALVPLPRRTLAWGTTLAISPPTLAIEGAGEAEAEELAGIAAAGGLTVAATGALRVVLHPPGRWAAVASACGLDPEPARGAYYLVVRDDGVGPIASVFAADDDGRWYALKTLRQLVAAGPTVRACAIEDRPATAMRGVIEGFYGPPWSAEARARMLAAFGDLKLDTFVYAPKDDHSVNLLWMVPWTQADLDRFAAIRSEAARNRIRACFALHPAFTMVFSSQDAFDTVVGKFRQVAGLGYRCFVLAYDDVPKVLEADDQKVYGSFVEAQIDFANRVGRALLADHPDAQLGFVPTDYWTDADGFATDVGWLGEHLDPEWLVAWTGTGILPATISVADADAWQAVARHPTLLGDNFTAMDDATASGVLCLGPLEGREPGLATRLPGIVFNPGPLALASLPPLAVAADWMWNPGAYEPARSMRSAARWLAGDAGAEPFATFCEANQSPHALPTADPALAAEADALWTGWPATGPLQALRARFERYRDVPAGLAASSLDPDLAAEVQPWIDELGAIGEAGLRALDLLATAAAGGPVDAGAVGDLRGRVEALAATTPKPCGKAADAFFARALEVLAP